MPKIIYQKPISGPKSGPTKRLTTEEFIKRARKVHGNKYDYSKVDYKNARAKVTIICPEHGEFEQTPNSHTNGNGCPGCGRAADAKNKTKSVEKFIEEAQTVHGSKYDYSKVNYKRCGDKVIIICPIHGEFQQTPSSHRVGDGCPKCVGKRRVNDKLTTKEFIQRARTGHGGRYDYSKVVYKNRSTKVVILCPIHGEFLQTPGDHISGRGCPKCNRGGGIGSSRYKDKTPGILYCVKCKWKNDSGYFTKIGITDRGLFKRFPKHPTKKYPFQITEYFIVDGEIGDMQRLEDKVKDEFVEFKYVPKVKFAGYTECFEVTEHDKIVRFIKQNWCG